MNRALRGPIVAGTHGSELSRSAIAEAGSLARQSGRSVVLVFVRQLRFEGSVSAFAFGAITHLNDAVDAEQIVAQAQGIALLDPLGIEWKLDIRCGQPATELMKAARAHSAETIVVGGRRRGTVGSIAHSSVSAQLLHRWPRSLLIIRPPDGPLLVTSEAIKGT